MFDNFEVILRGPDERAHRPPRGFHTFNVNQLEMGLRFPLPRFTAALCQHIKISLSQLAPNSYSFLLSLDILLRYHNLSLIPYVLMQLIQIKRLGPGVGDPDPPPGEAAEEHKTGAGRRSIRKQQFIIVTHRAFKRVTLLALVPGSNRYYNNPALLGRLR
ncbi:glucan endo-1,3-beta-glucosidase 6-like [Dorcoceras hygrometricum]|uniref:Glucan endo-1,3-beta-glucosidase 6-like n=1 Tax=Dorcoceras hygrometricum TaxID=472368 RepID=A0A2Z7AGR8_9LAMI|nr:glucan endo-1,3-beta-glucosidase 6-like [Dorcoceras hygrometricum]